MLKGILLQLYPALSNTLLNKGAPHRRGRQGRRRDQQMALAQRWLSPRMWEWGTHGSGACRQPRLVSTPSSHFLPTPVTDHSLCFCSSRHCAGYKTLSPWQGDEVWRGPARRTLWHSAVRSPSPSSSSRPGRPRSAFSSEPAAYTNSSSSRFPSPFAHLDR